MDLASLKPRFSFPPFSKMFGKKKAVSQVSEVCLACDFGRAKVVFVEIEKGPHGLKLLKFQKMPRPPGGKDPDVLKELFLKGGFQTNKVRIALKGQGVVIRFIQFPMMKEPELRSAISFEIDQYIPFKANEVLWDIYILDDNVQVNGKPMMNVMLVAVKREELYSALQVFQNADLQVVLIDVDAIVSINALEYLHPNDMAPPTAILDIGSEISTLCVVQGGKPKFIRDMTYGGVDIIKKMKRKLTLTQEQALQLIEVDRVPSPEIAEVISDALGDLVSELKVTLNYYYDQIPGAEPIKKMFIEGGGGYHPLVIQKLNADFGFGVEMMNILDKVQLADGVDPNIIRLNQGILPMPIGLCLRNV